MRINTTLSRYLPALASLQNYSKMDFRADFFAGITVATVAVPQAMAYASIFGVPVQYGLYTAIVMTFVGALFDSSKQLINGPTNAISIALLSALAFVPEQQRISAAILLAFLVGCIQIIITLFRLGDLSRFISHSVIVGFTAGASVLLVLDQTKNALGLNSLGGHSDHFLQRFYLTLTQGGSVHLITLGLFVFTIVSVLLLRVIKNKFKIFLPEFLIAVFLSALIVWIFKLENSGVRIVGNIPRSLPGFAIPEFDLTTARNLFGSAIALALLGLLEAIAMAKSLAAKSGEKLDVNQQCLSEGVANLTGSFFGCFVGSGSLTRSAINQEAGGRTQWSGIVSAIAVALTVVFFAPYARYIPRATLSGILILTAVRMINWKELKYYLKATRFDYWVVILTALTAVFISIEFCILIGTLASFVFYVPKAAKIHNAELIMTPDNLIREKSEGEVSCSRIRLFNIEGELFFGVGTELEDILKGIENSISSKTRIILLRLKHARNPDSVCLHLLDEFVGKMHSRNIKVVFCGIKQNLVEIFRNAGLAQKIGSEQIFVESSKLWSSTLEAIKWSYQQIKDDLCEHCPRKHSILENEKWYYVI